MWRWLYRFFPLKADHVSAIWLADQAYRKQGIEQSCIQTWPLPHVDTREDRLA